MLSNSLFIRPKLPGQTDDTTLRPHEEANREALKQLVRLRWIAFAGQLVTVLGVHYGQGLRLPLGTMLCLLAVLALFNAASHQRARMKRKVSPLELLGGLMVDLLMLTALLGLSGGVNNPFVFLYLPQVAVAALMLERKLVWAITIAAALAIVVLATWHVPLQWRDAPEPELSQQYVIGLLVCFLICAALVVVVIFRFVHLLSRRDERLAAMRQRAVEEDQIVRIGLLASGAAHELSTPLATVSVILGDWAHMKVFATDTELREELKQMQAQVQRCKGIISGILLATGNARADITGTTTLQGFLLELAEQWSRDRGIAPLAPAFKSLPEQAIVADTGLRQAITNVLDNALEAAKGKAPRFLASADEERLRLVVHDQGPGFSLASLEHFGRPYHSSKNQPGSGLGIFLTINVVRKLGGQVQARNHEEGGGEVMIELPLSALMVHVSPGHANPAAS